MGDISALNYKTEGYICHFALYSMMEHDLVKLSELGNHDP